MGADVALLHTPSGRWKERGVIVELRSDRSYLVKTMAGRIKIRNRRHLRPIKVEPITRQPVQEGSAPRQPVQDGGAPRQPVQDGGTPVQDGTAAQNNRPKRQIKRPTRYDD